MRLRLILIPIVSISFLWAAGLVFFYSQIPSSHEIPEEKSDAIIVLTGGNDRIAEGINLLGKGKADKLLISGVNKHSNFSDLLSGQGLEDILSTGVSLIGKIDLGRKAVDTVGNAKEAADWVKKNDVNSIILVTSNYHMPRALVEFRKMMPKKEITAYAVITDKFNKSNWMNDKSSRDLIIREYHKFLYAVFI